MIINEAKSQTEEPTSQASYSCRHRRLSQLSLQRAGEFAAKMFHPGCHHRACLFRLEADHPPFQRLLELLFLACRLVGHKHHSAFAQQIAQGPSKAGRQFDAPGTRKGTRQTLGAESGGRVAGPRRHLSLVKQITPSTNGYPIMPSSSTWSADGKVDCQNKLNTATEETRGD